MAGKAMNSKCWNNVPKYVLMVFVSYVLFALILSVPVGVVMTFFIISLFKLKEIFWPRILLASTVLLTITFALFKTLYLAD